MDENRTNQMSISLKPLVSVILLINNRIKLTINWLLLQTSMLQSLWNNIMVKTKMGNISSNNIIYSECSSQAVINPIDVYNSTTTYTVIYSILVS